MPHAAYLDLLTEHAPGANWIQGTQTDDGPANPIWTLAQKHNLSTHFNDWFGSICACPLVYRGDPDPNVRTSDVRLNRRC